MEEEFEIFDEFTDNEIEDMVVAVLGDFVCASNASQFSETGGTNCVCQALACLGVGPGSCL